MVTSDHILILRAVHTECVAERYGLADMRLPVNVVIVLSEFNYSGRVRVRARIRAYPRIV